MKQDRNQTRAAPSAACWREIDEETGIRFLLSASSVLLALVSIAAGFAGTWKAKGRSLEL